MNEDELEGFTHKCCHLEERNLFSGEGEIASNNCNIFSLKEWGGETSSKKLK